MDIANVVAVIILVGAGALLFMISKILHKKYRTQLELVGQKQAVISILDEAVNNRCRLDIKFIKGDMGGRYMRGPCMAIGSEKILVDTGLRYGLQGWIGQEVHVFFQLSNAEGLRYYDFFSSVTRVHRYEGGYALELETPNSLNNNQKRTFVRLIPTWRMVRELNLWTQLTESGLSTPPVDMPPPAYTAASVTVDNISGGGIRLIIALEEGEDPPLLTREEKLYFYLSVQGMEHKENLQLWLVGEIVDFKATTPEIFSLSLRFQSWAPDTASDLELSWFPVDGEGGVPPLAAWVMLRHLEMSRRQAGGLN
ncbi:MAG: hypothetical protein RR317_00290 [Bilophila sp.]